nr:unnamed protein product [Callosobruchus chinensis]
MVNCTTGHSKLRRI